MVYVISYLVSGIIFGFVSKTINENKGYEGGFAWGFFLGILGVIVVACKPTASQQSYYSSQGSFYAQDQMLINQGGWKCSNCGKVNAASVTTCICGRRKESKSNEAETKKNQNESYKKESTDEKIELIKKLADLHSQGILTDEEYETKKAELLARM